MQLLLEQSRVNSQALWFNKFHYYLRTKHSFPPPLCTADSQTFVDCFITQFTKSPSNCGLIRLLLPSLLEDNLLSLPLSTSAASQKPSPWLQTSQESWQRARHQRWCRPAMNEEAVAGAVSQTHPVWQLLLIYDFQQHPRIVWWLDIWPKSLEEERYFSVYICVHMYWWGVPCMYTHRMKPEVDVGCLSGSLSTFFSI